VGRLGAGDERLGRQSSTSAPSPSKATRSSAGCWAKRPPRPRAPTTSSGAVTSPSCIAAGGPRPKSLSRVSSSSACMSCCAIRSTMRSFGGAAARGRYRGRPSPSPSARTIGTRLPQADGPVRASSGSPMACHDRAIEWDAHPRRSAVVIVDDRILTSCAAVRARMDGWWTFAGGSTTLHACLSTRRDKRNDAGALDANDRSHGSMMWSARPSTDCGIVKPRAFAVLRLITSSNFVGCSTGRSAGLAPLRMRSTYEAARLRRCAHLAHARCDGADRHDPEGAGAFLRHPREGLLDVVWALGRYHSEIKAEPSGVSLHLLLTNGSETRECRV